MKQELSLVVVSRELQPTCLAYISPDIKKGRTPPKHADRSDPLIEKRAKCKLTGFEAGV
jgi:hypothetical protein